MSQMGPWAKPSEPGFVYFIQAGHIAGPVKVGWTRDPEQRLRDLQVGSPLKLRLVGLVEGDKSLERELHQRLASCRIRGEWFKWSAEVRSAMWDEQALGAADSRRPYVYLAERCDNCEAPLVVGENDLCKACVEFRHLWDTEAV